MVFFTDPSMTNVNAEQKLQGVLHYQELDRYCNPIQSNFIANFMTLSDLPALIRSEIANGIINSGTPERIAKVAADLTRGLAERDMKITALEKMILAVKAQNEELLFQLETAQLYLAETKEV